MSTTEPLDIEAIKARIERGYPDHWTSGAAATARHNDMLALIAEVERLREVEHALDLVKRGIVEYRLPSADAEDRSVRGRTL